MDILMHHDWNSDQMRLLEDLSWIIMFLMITGNTLHASCYILKHWLTLVVLFVIIFNVKSVGLEAHKREPIERGLSNWRSLWSKNAERFERIETLGIAKYIPEFWQLTMLFWNNDLESAGEQLNPDMDSMDELHNMLKKFEAVSISNASKST